MGTTWPRCPRVSPGRPTRTCVPPPPLPTPPGDFTGCSSPEVNHTQHGTDMIRNFLYKVCTPRGTGPWGTTAAPPWPPFGKKVGKGRVLLALSGGVDSSVAAALLAEAVGRQLTCVFVDHGLMRLHEGDEVEAAFAKWTSVSSAWTQSPASC